MDTQSHDMASDLPGALATLELSDAQLLAEFQRTRSETAFGAIVERHSAMVFRTCYRKLQNTHEAEDAAQAVFIALAERSHAARSPLATWLYDLACSSAGVALKSRIRRMRRERDAGSEARSSSMVRQFDLQDELDLALARLPVRWREAVVLHYLEGRGLEESARAAGCPARTFARYCTEGIERLREILCTRGAVMSTSAMIVLLAQESAESLSPLKPVAIKAALAGLAANNSSAASTASALLKVLVWTKLKVFALVAAVAVIAVPAVSLARFELSTARQQATPPAARTETLPQVVETEQPPERRPSAPAIQKSAGPEWHELFNGKDISGWDVAKGTWLVDAGELVGDDSVGDPDHPGARVDSRAQFAEFELTFSVKSERLRDVEVQIGSRSFEFPFHSPNRGVWHEVRILAKEGKADAWLDGEPVAPDQSDSSGVLSPGIISLFVIKDGKARFKHIRIRELTRAAASSTHEVR
jgi:RNA polymerase sigma factor (sigma-70 family)